MKQLLEAGTAVIADVYDSIGRIPTVLSNSIVPLKQGESFIGPAFTVNGVAAVTAETGDRAKLGAIDAMPRGAIAVWAGNDIRGVCCFGDLLSEAMCARGVAGVVVDGGVRDVDYLGTLDLPIRARYRSPAQAIGRWKVTSHQEPVKLRGALADWVVVNPGDLIVADGDGVVVVPDDEVELVSQKIVEWAAVETESRSAIRDGMPLLEAITRFGHL
ncbi:MAG TPA: hypothetical protein VGC45_03310 [Gryllotalpicola sp.]